MKKTFILYSLLIVNSLIMMFVVNCAWASATDGTLKWHFQAGGYVDSSPAIGSDNTVYVGASMAEKLYAINPDGTLKWAFQTGVPSSPAIGSDGTVYVAVGFDEDADKNLYAINPDGTLKWAFQIGSSAQSCPAIASDGTVYLGSDDKNLYAINPDGTLKWAFQTESYVRSSPAIGSDGTIYVASQDGNLYGINPDGTLKWTFSLVDDDSVWVSSPAIDFDGTIYVGARFNFYAINPNGTEKWVLSMYLPTMSSPAIACDGTVYVGAGDSNLYAINPDGTEKWAFQTDLGAPSSPAIGCDGTIYVGAGDSNLYAINPDGTEKWAFSTGNEVRSSPAIGCDGTIYVGSRDGNLYAINGSSGGLADSPWPMFHHDVKHTGRMATCVTIRARTDGNDILYLHGNTIRWWHRNFQIVGWGDCYYPEPGQYPTYVNGQEWFPDWPDAPPDTGCSWQGYSSSYTNPAGPLARLEVPVRIEVIAARHQITIEQQPDASNDYTAAILFNDDPPGGADWYEVRICYASEPCSVEGDLDGDCDVDFDDLAIVTGCFGQDPNVCDPRADVNGDGAVNILDVSLVVSNFT